MTLASFPFHIFIIEDEPAIRRFLRTSLSAHGYRVTETDNGKDAVQLLLRLQPDLLILDLGLPDLDGFTVISLVRDASISVPIIILSSRSDESGKVKALDLGADDYVTKPFGINELLARMRAALRHRMTQKDEQPIYKNSRFEVDLVRRKILLEKEEIKLSPREYDLLALLVKHADKVLTHKFILQELWNSKDTDIQYLRMYIRALRTKLEADHNQPIYILTETGIGYRLQSE